MCASSPLNSRRYQALTYSPGQEFLHFYWQVNRSQTSRVNCRSVTFWGGGGGLLMSQRGSYVSRRWTLPLPWIKNGLVQVGWGLGLLPIWVGHRGAGLPLPPLVGPYTLEASLRQVGPTQIFGLGLITLPGRSHEGRHPLKLWVGPT